MFQYLYLIPFTSSCTIDPLDLRETKTELPFMISWSWTISMLTNHHKLALHHINSEQFRRKKCWILQKGVENLLEMTLKRYKTNIK